MESNLTNSQINAAYEDALLYESVEILEEQLCINNENIAQEFMKLCKFSNNQVGDGRALKRKLINEGASTSINEGASTSKEPRLDHLAVSSSNAPSSSPQNIEINVSTKNNDEIECSVCKIVVSKRFLSSHLKSNQHKNNLVSSHEELPNVQKIESAFGNRILTYRVSNDNPTPALEFQTPELFMKNIKDTIFILLDRCIKEHVVIKVNFILRADFVQETKDLENTFDFQTFNYVFCQGDNISITFLSLAEEISNKVSNFECKDSGWSLRKIKHLDMNVNKFDPLHGSSYIDLPHDIKLKKAVINVKNKDHQCFLWSVLSALYPTDKNSDRVTSYLQHKNKLNFDDIPFPVKIKDIHKFERLNDLSINVFGLEYDSESKSHKVTGPLHFTKSRKSTHVNLLYISHNNKSHYCYIKNLSRLVSKQISSRHIAMHICDGCLLHFSSADQLQKHQQHDCAHVRVDLPSDKRYRMNWFRESVPGNQIEFDKYERQLRVPFVVYADFEALLNPIEGCETDPNKSSTTNVQKHEVYSFGYYIKCSFDDKLSKYRTYKGKDCSKKFMTLLKDDLQEICKKRTFKKSPSPLTTENETCIAQSKVCYICKKELLNDFIIDHDWYTGHYAGVAHSLCAEKYRTGNFVPVFFHNLSNYDAHFLVHALNFEEGEIEVIPQNKERYISFSKQLKINNHTMKLRFLDSFKFMSSSLEKLAQNLKPEEFREMSLNFPNEDDFKRLIRKGVYPYEFMTSHDSLNMKSLPPPEKFYNSLNDKHVTENDYAHAKDVWNHFKCKNMGDYSDLYLKTDVLILADVFENFRNVCLKTYELDPAHYYTAPGLSWDAMLSFTKVRLELLTDFEKIAFIKKGIRGGISQCSNRHAKANNKFMPDYDSNLPSSYLVYYDSNNLYGWSMSQHLPTGNFEWVDSDTNFNVADDADEGFILEVDLEYPENLHDSHSDLPFCPENICINDKQKKLIPNLFNKEKYVIHYRNLKQCLEKGMRLNKVHRILKFSQSAWLKKYIDLNTQKRSMSSTEFEKDFFKLMNNSVFGKTMENIEKRVNVKLVDQWGDRGKVQGAKSLIAKPEFHSLAIFSENLVAVQLNKTKVLYNKPIYLGFCVLDISKTLMYQFHYDFMKNKFKDNLKLLYTDTDSLIYQVFTENFYSDIKDDLETHFDTSDYSPNNEFGFPLINKKKLGFFKDENNGKIFKEFVGLRAKMYAMDVQNKFTAKAKGVNKCVTQRFNLDDYKKCLLRKTDKISTMLRFRSLKHTIYTQKINKVSLSHNDSKRFLLSNSTDTLAWGHYKVRNIQS